MKQYHIKTGDKFNRLTAVKLSHIGKHNRSYFLFRCECGNKKILLGSLVKSGNTKSCGCLSAEVKKNRRMPQNHSEITAIILGYKRHAIDRGFKWKLKRNDVENIIKQNCFYCKSIPANIKKTRNSVNGGLLYSGIDRIDSTRDYTKNNVVPCCRICNYAKSNMDTNTFQEWAIKLGKNAMADQWG